MAIFNSYVCHYQRVTNKSPIHANPGHETANLCLCFLLWVDYPAFCERRQLHSVCTWYWHVPRPSDPNDVTTFMKLILLVHTNLFTRVRDFDLHSTCTCHWSSRTYPKNANSHVTCKVKKQKMHHSHVICTVDWTTFVQWIEKDIGPLQLT